MPSNLADIAELNHPSHSCLIYETTEEQVDVTSEFLARGLMRGELCVFLEAPKTLDLVRITLEKAGINVREEEKRGALVLTPNLDFLLNGHFQGPRTISFLIETVSRAAKEGFTGLRATGDMNWELGNDQDFSLLIDYEAHLDEFVLRHPIVGLCQYRHPSIAGLAIRNALETHERVILKRILCNNNLFYLPPEIRLETNLAKQQQRHIEWMCERLTESMVSDRQRDAALRALLEKEERYNELIKSLDPTPLPIKKTGAVH